MGSVQRGHGRRRSLSAIPSVFLLLLIIAMVLAPSASAGYVYCRFEAGKVYEEIDVEPGAQTSYTFETTLKVTRAPTSGAQQIILMFSASTDEPGWGASVIPPVTVVNMGPSILIYLIHLKVVVSAPQDAPFNTMANATIAGTWELNPGLVRGEIDPIVFTCAPTQYHYIEGYVKDGGFTRVRPGEKASYTLLLTNFGNGEDRYNITVEETVLRSIEKEGFAVVIPENTVDVAPWEEVAVKVDVYGPRGWKQSSPWKTRLTMIPIVITSEYAQKKNDPEVEVLFVMYYERGPYIPGFYLVSLIILLALLVALMKVRSKKGYLWDSTRKGRKKKRLSWRRKPPGEE